MFGERIRAGRRFSGLRLVLVLLLGGLVALHILSPAPVVTLRYALFDQYQRLFPRERANLPAVIVGIDEYALQIAGQWPWARSTVADLLNRIHAMQPAAVGFDVTFSEPDRLSLNHFAAQARDLPPDVTAKLAAIPSNDALFAASLMRGHTVLAIVAESEPSAGTRPPVVPPLKVAPGADSGLRRYPGYQHSIDMLAQAATGQGMINADMVNGVHRTAPLLAHVQDRIMPALALEMWRAATNAPMELRRTDQGLLEVQLGAVAIPLQADGTFWMHFGRFDKDRVVSAGEVLNGRANPELFANKLVLIGATGIGMLDYKTTPLGEFIPGVDIHAQMIEQIFDHDYLVRPPWTLWLEVFLLAASAMTLSWLIGRLRAGQSIAAVVGMLLWLALIGIAMFRFAGVLIDVAWPAIGLLTAAGFALADTLAKSERHRRELRELAARISGELNAAQRIQMGLLPDPQDVFGDERRFTVAATLEPARTVGGDFYDCFMLDTDRMFFIVADVSGKGLAAALFMAAVKSHLKSAALQEGGDPTRIMLRAQAEIGRENPEALFVTAFAAILDARSGRLDYVNAGHDPPFVHRPGGGHFRLEQAGGPPLGTMEAFEYPSGTRQMAAGEWIFVVTDGVTEAMNAAKELYGAERLMALLAQPPELEWPNELIKRVCNGVHEYSQGTDPADDLTLLALRWNG